MRCNLSPPRKVKNCHGDRYVCRCGASDHVITSKHCPNHHLADETLLKKIKSMNLYHAKRANKASKFDHWKQYNPLHPNNTSNNLPSINNRKDGTGYNNKQ